MSSAEKISNRLDADAVIAGLFKKGQILSTDDFVETYEKFGLSPRTATSSLTNLMRVGRFTRETGTPIRRVRYGRRLYYMHTGIAEDPGVMDRLRLISEENKVKSPR